jgi:hypothetical protein
MLKIKNIFLYKKIKAYIAKKAIYAFHCLHKFCTTIYLNFAVQEGIFLNYMIQKALILKDF